MRTTANPSDFENDDTTVFVEPVDQASAPAQDPDDLLKYVDVALQPYMSAIRRLDNDVFLLVFKGGEAIEVPTFQDLLGLRLRKRERSSILIDIRQKITLRVSLHLGRAQKGGVVEYRRK